MSAKGNTKKLEDIRLTLIGRKWSGKSIAGNTILGCEAFHVDDETIKNTTGHGEVAGRWRVTAVETPGWWKPFDPRETMELTKMKIIQSVSQGPHAILLVIDMDTVLEEKSTNAIESHLGLLGGDVWDHTIVLLNYGVWRKTFTTVTDYMDKRGNSLRKIIKKCGGRYHLLNNTDRTSDTQVRELLIKVEKMVTSNGGKFFELDAALAQSVESKMKAVRENAKRREDSAIIERNALSEMYQGEDHRLAEIRLMLVGWTLSGKTSVADTILGVPTAEKTKTIRSTERRGQVGRWAVRVVDTPGWWRFASLNETPEMVKQELVKGVSMSPPGHHAVVVVVCACIAFTEAHLRAIREHISYLGPDVWRHTLVLLNWCDAIGKTSVEEFIEGEGKALQWLLGKCENRYHSLNRDDGPSQVTGLLEKIEWMVAGNSVLRLHRPEMEEWEDGGTVIDSVPVEAQLLELVEKMCRQREAEFWESIRRVVVIPEKAGSIADPPYFSNEVPPSFEEDTDYESSSDCYSMMSHSLQEAETQEGII